MKGATGEQWPYWEEDFGDGGDMIGEIMEGPDAAERMELELATRLGAGNVRIYPWGNSIRSVIILIV